MTYLCTRFQHALSMLIESSLTHTWTSKVFGKYILSIHNCLFGVLKAFKSSCISQLALFHGAISVTKCPALFLCRRWIKCKCNKIQFFHEAFWTNLPSSQAVLPWDSSGLLRWAQSGCYPEQHSCSCHPATLLPVPVAAIKSVCWPLRKLTKEKHQLECDPLIAGLGCRGRGKCMCRAATCCSQPVQLDSAPCTPSHVYPSKGQHNSSLWSMFSTLSKCYGNSLLYCLGSY